MPIIQKIAAWDDEIIVLNNILDKEENDKAKFNLKRDLLLASFEAKKYQDVIEIGEKLLETESVENFSSSEKRNDIIGRVIISCFKRSKIDKTAFKKAKEIIKKHPVEKPSFEFKILLAELYVKHNEPQNALKSIIEGVKIKKRPSPEEYAELFFPLMHQIRTKTGLKSEKSDSLKTIQENTFVKLKNEDQWRFIGNGDELDAQPITKIHERFSLYLGKKIGETIFFENRYGSQSREDFIELIFPIEKYVLWQIDYNLNKVASSGDVEWLKTIEIPEKKPARYLLKRSEDQNKEKKNFFDENYCQGNIPLAFLAFIEGNLMGAIYRIEQEERGFINFSSDDGEFEKQKEIAKKIILEKRHFYIDGTSAFFLSESGLLKKIRRTLPNLKIPQSVIMFLYDIIEKFEDSQIFGAKERFECFKGKIYFRPIDKKDEQIVKTDFIEAVKLLEGTPKNCVPLSPASKIGFSLNDKLFHDKLPELIDASVLAEKESLPILTEDSLYLKGVELKTNKKPLYFSSFALLRVLYEEGKLCFEDYLTYFSYLSSYRFRFLSVSSDDLEKAVFGDKETKTIPENIRKFNFQLTLSEEYGVSFQDALVVIKFFLLQTLAKPTKNDLCEKIFKETIDCFPIKIKKNLGKTF